MKKIIKALTYAELIIVISIMTILTSSISYYFVDFVNKNNFKNEINEFLYIIEEEDYKIQNKEIFDYEIDLNIWKNIYTIKEDTQSSKYKIDYWFASSKISLVETLEDNKKLEINVFENWKLLKNIIPEENEYLIDFEENTNNIFVETYLITEIEENKLIKERLNNLIINKINPDWSIKLQKISSSLNWEDILNLKIINISWNKSYYSSWEKIDSENIYLYFLKDDKEEFINLKL